MLEALWGLTLDCGSNRLLDLPRRDVAISALDLLSKEHTANQSRKKWIPCGLPPKCVQRVVRELDPFAHWALDELRKAAPVAGPIEVVDAYRDELIEKLPLRLDDRLHLLTADQNETESRVAADAANRQKERAAGKAALVEIDREFIKFIEDEQYT